MKTKVCGLFLLFSTLSQAADFQCFDFFRRDLGHALPLSVPAIVTSRVQTGDGVTHVFSQDIVPLNESVDNALVNLKEGGQVCLKGTRGYDSPSKFFAYELRTTPPTDNSFF